MYESIDTLSQHFKTYSANEPTSEFNQPVVTNDTFGIISNLVQGAYTATFPALANESLLYSALVDDEFYARNASAGNPTNPNITGLLPLTSPGPAVIQGVYLCHFQRAKSRGSAFLAVLVGTHSMVSSGWAIFLGLAATVVKKRVPSKNACVEHGTLARSSYAASMEKDVL
ncbi:hypothetical protein B0H14DRAFT_3770095 [Mycena olivaceomarginata]|nr:hypothetical protein B0H14DRAFT_3770095 [Mycena olivaceomarginata]